MNDHSLSDLLPEYALGGLSESETAEVESWLATSEQGRAELREYQLTLETMANLTPPRPIPDRMVTDFAQRLALSESRTVVLQPRRSFRRILLGLAALLVLGFGLLMIVQRYAFPSDVQVIQSIRENPAAVVVSLAAQGESIGSVSLRNIPGSRQAVLSVNLPSLPSDKIYELWLINETPIPSGVFTVNQQTSDILITLPGPIQDYKIAAITIEPWSKIGSVAPTSDPIFVGSVQLRGL